MLSIAVDLDEVGAVGDAVEHRLLGIELFAQLIEIRELESRSQPNRSGVRRQLAEE